jgi:DNA-binding NarL/FixJ family response regulator
MIRLALLDDHPAVLTGLQRLLEPVHDMEVLAAADDEVALARALDGRRADVVMLDYDPERGDALALCRRMKSRPEAPRVLIYTAYASPALTIAARAVQADGVVDKSETAATLLDAIRRIADEGYGSIRPRRIA